MVESRKKKKKNKVESATKVYVVDVIENVEVNVDGTKEMPNEEGKAEREGSASTNVGDFLSWWISHRIEHYEPRGDGETFGMRLKRLRKTAGLTLKQLSEKSFFSYVTLYHL